LKAHTFDALVVAEHHLQGRELNMERRRLRKQGWKMFPCPATRTDTEAGTSGGTWVLTAGHLGAYPVLHRQVIKEENMGQQWSAAGIRYRTFDIILISLYLTAGVGFEGNRTTLQALATFVKSLKVAFLIMGDWNFPWSELEKHGWLGQIAGVVLLPSNTSTTCSQGRGRIIDYGVTSRQLWPYLEAEVDLEGPWTPHKGIKISLQAIPETLLELVNHKPKDIPQAQGPTPKWSYYQQLASDTNTRHSEALAEHGGSEALTRRFGTWSVAAEHLLCDRAGLSFAQRAGYMGRGRPPEFRLRPVLKPNKADTRHDSAASNFWSALYARLRDLRQEIIHARVRRQKVDTKTWHWIKEAMNRVPKNLPATGGDKVLGAVATVTATLTTVPNKEQLDGIIKVVSQLKQWAILDVFKQCRQGFREWIQQHLRNPKALHAYSKAETQPEPPSSTVLVEGKIVTQPHIVMQHKLKFWTDL
jgi:hypothetical protein